MRSARLKTGATRLVVEERPDPVPRRGAAVVRLQSTFLSATVANLVGGTSAFQTPARPFAPGMDAVGTVERLGEGVSGLAVGDRVYCDSYIEETRADGSGEMVFAGYMGLSANCARLLAEWPEGALATHIELPAECLTNVGPALARTSADTLSRLGWLGTAHAAFEKSGFQPGQSVAVLGATGLLGVSTVLVALAMGADRVVAVGRSRERLAAFEGLDPRIVTALAPPGPEAPVDLAVFAGSDGADVIERSLPGLKRYGSLVLLATPSTPPRYTGLLLRDITIRNSLWFPRRTPARLVAMIASGTLALDRITSQAFPLDRVNDAVAACASAVPPFSQVVVNS